MDHHPILLAAARKKPEVLNIGIVDLSGGKAPCNLDDLTAALQTQADRDFTPDWGTKINLFRVDDETDTYHRIRVVNRLEVKGAAGYHEISPAGHAIGYVGLDVNRTKDQFTECMSHEALEMYANPFVDVVVRNPKNGWLYAGEMCDMGQAETYRVDGFALGNFTLRAWWDVNSPAGAKLDFLGKRKKPFEIGPQGYMPVDKQDGKGWTQIFPDRGPGRMLYKAEEHGRAEAILEILNNLTGQGGFDPSLLPTTHPLA